MRFLGIDPGLRITGYACVDLAPGAREPTLVEAGVVRLRPADPVAARLRALHEELGAIVDELRPHRVAVASSPRRASRNRCSRRPRR